MILLICGSRTWRDEGRLFSILDLRTELAMPTKVIVGGAQGADRLAELWARARGIPVAAFKAEWTAHGGKSAGPIRNRRMLLEGRPDMVIAFRMPGVSKGTDHMVEIAEKAGVPVEVVRG